MQTLRERRRPLAPFFAMVVIAALVLGAGFSLDWGLDVFLDSQERAKAFRRLGNFLSSFATPDLSNEWLEKSWGWTLNTLATAVIGAAIGIVFGYFLSLLAARSVVVGQRGSASGNTGLRLVGLGVCGVARLLLDVLRAVPDFAWAVMLIPLTGLGPQTGALAIGISVAGILGKIYSELWDNVDPRRYQAVTASGASRLGVFFFGVQPNAARPALSFTLMRTECAVRNASVIGVVGGGGIGAEIFDQLKYGDFGRVTTLLFFVLLLTLSVDLLSNALRRRLRNDPNHPRATQAKSHRHQIWRSWSGGLLALVVVLWAIDSLDRDLEELSGLFDANGWRMIQRLFGGLLEPDFSSETLTSVLGSTLYPLSIAVIGTLLGLAAAGVVAYTHSVSFQVESHRFTGERMSYVTRVWRWSLMVVSRLFALVSRGVPEVAWALILVFFFTQGAWPAALAIAIHTFGILARVFTESVDDLPYRKLERLHVGTRGKTFGNVAVPYVWREWATYALFQFESNVRTGVALGIVGLGGLGFAFKAYFDWFEFEQASTYLIAMILLTLVIDRISRALKLSRQ